MEVKKKFFHMRQSLKKARVAWYKKFTDRFWKVFKKSKKNPFD